MADGAREIPGARTVVAVVPVDIADRAMFRGWIGGRTNGLTVTLSHQFAAADAALAAAQRLPAAVVWALEP
jgi:hypothetical protein